MTLAAPIGEVFSQTVLTGPMLLAIPVAVLAGAVSFFSPCVLPLVPGYVGYVTGLGATALTDRKTSKVIIGVSLFISGFAVVFVTIGLAFSAAGVLLSQWADVLNRVMGIVVIIAGIVFMGGIGMFQRSTQISKRPPAGLWGAPALGATFALSWAPCMGPTLAAVLALSTSFGATGTDGIWRGAALTLMYCLGLGVPFIVVAVLIVKGTGRLQWARDHQILISRIGGGMLIIIGLLLVTGVWTHWVNSLQGMIGGFQTTIGWARCVHPGFAIGSPRVWWRV
ncbi:cytochrome c biogenesis CcdA family protein [Brevibacterium sp. p3-SID960]|uniref:cytochrome c biogenesis CcdA family protein n=1 Tax=Brevibacterium sp. p3-SID960 TaxID=2916063 RepID=UPI0021A43916|nr:cytochrome c biogenesis CcdA family protein [Brevibacterium sp. p3-SID960]MCT1690788.1 cytochrome c biogenesis CcdA family protein [Brevibacterium sp. p3-SID960]